MLCLFGLRNFDTIQYALCHRKFYMINQKFMKLCTLQDPNMKMCTLIVYPGPSGFPKIMNLKVVFQIFVGSIKMMGTRGVLVPHSGQLIISFMYQCGTPASSSTSSYYCSRQILFFIDAYGSEHNANAFMNKFVLHVTM